jgi:hypothetical protein
MLDFFLLGRVRDVFGTRFAFQHDVGALSGHAVSMKTPGFSYLFHVADFAQAVGHPLGVDETARPTARDAAIR